MGNFLTRIRSQFFQRAAESHSDADGQDRLRWASQQGWDSLHLGTGGPLHRHLGLWPEVQTQAPTGTRAYSFSYSSSDSVKKRVGLEYGRKMNF